MWLERYVIVVVSLQRDFLPPSGACTADHLGHRHLAGTIGLFCSCSSSSSGSMPMISIFEVRTLLPQAEVTEGVEK